jgi:hypothetical protein
MKELTCLKAFATILFFFSERRPEPGGTIIFLPKSLGMRLICGLLFPPLFPPLFCCTAFLKVDREKTMVTSSSASGVISSGKFREISRKIRGNYLDERNQREWASRFSVWPEVLF